MSNCNHRKCVICLERECHKKLAERFQVYGSFTVCNSCVIAAISWAHTTACRWGGLYGAGKPCGLAGQPEASRKVEA